MASKWLSESKEEEIQHIIQKLTTTGRKTLDEGEMTKLKKICKKSDTYVNCAYHSLMTQLRKDHAEIRYSSLLIINELVMRSSLFRNKLEADLEEFLELVEETDSEKPLPLPVPVAKDLKIKGLEFIKAWSTKFGEKHIRLSLALNYLKKCKKIDFNDMEARNSVQLQRQQEEQRHRERINERLIEKIKNELLEVIEELSNITTQMDNCFRLLLPHVADDLFTVDDFEESENAALDHIGTSNVDASANLGNKLRDHGIYDLKKSIIIELEKNSEIAVHSNEDTAPIIENLKGLEKQISRMFYPKVTKWIKSLSKCNNCSDLVKQLIDLKLIMEEKLEKCKELKIKPSKDKIDSDDEDDDFEEVKDKEGYEEMVKTPSKSAASSKPSCSKTDPNVELPDQWRMKHSSDDVKDPTTALSNISQRCKSSRQVTSDVKDESISPNKKKSKDGKKAELLEKAPVLPYDIDLYHWEEEKPLVPEKVRFDSLHKFWETKDDDDEENETLKEAQRASLRTRKIDFSGKFEPVKWSCRAPLQNGKLCPRKDRYKCPFHGKIIPRDATGKPSGDPGSIAGPSKECANSVPDWQDPYLLNDIKAATGIDLKIPEKRSKGKKKKKEGLTNLKQINNTVRQRLAKKIVKRYRHYAPKIDEMERKRFNDKFGDQWNYY